MNHGQQDDDDRRVRPDGLAVRRRRHENGWSHRDLVRAIEEASVVASGVRESTTPNQLAGIEEHDEPVPYSLLRLVAAGLDCDPVDILLRPPEPKESPTTH